MMPRRRCDGRSHGRDGTVGVGQPRTRHHRKPVGRRGTARGNSTHPDAVAGAGGGFGARRWSRLPPSSPASCCSSTTRPAASRRIRPGRPRPRSTPTTPTTVSVPVLERSTVVRRMAAPSDATGPYFIWEDPVDASVGWIDVQRVNFLPDSGGQWILDLVAMPPELNSEAGPPPEREPGGSTPTAWCSTRTATGTPTTCSASTTTHQPRRSQRRGLRSQPLGHRSGVRKDRQPDGAGSQHRHRVGSGRG